MTRSNYYTQPYRKEIEMYQEFSGGMNSFSPNEDIRDNELALIKNKDLGIRGSLLRRYGMVKSLTSAGQAKGQGYFRYFKTDGTYEEITAINGHFEKNGVAQTITGLASFQTTKPVEAVQFRDKLYIATGTKLVVYDGVTFAVVVPYTPTALDGLYYGFNALAADPTNYMSDGVSAGINATGITFDKRYGVANQVITMTGHVDAPVGSTLQYKFEYRTTNMMDNFWTLGQDWGASKVFAFTPTETNDYQFKFSIRITGQTNAISFYQIPKYKVKSSVDPNDVAPDVSNIHGCNRILIHVNRIFLYGDTNNKDMVYISHLNNPLYFPVPNCLRFENPQNEKLQVVLHYRDRLVAMTDTSIQALTGKSPVDYTRIMLNTQVGCIAPYSAVVVENFIYFLSQDGVYRLKQVGFTEDRANVDKLDTKINNVVGRDANACGAFHNLQYHLVFPSQNKRFRFYNEIGAWLMDDSIKLDFANMYTFGGKLYGQSLANGNVMKFDTTVFTDDSIIYEEEIQSKAYNFNQPYHPKTLRSLIAYVSSDYGDFTSKLSVYADGNLIISADSSHATVDVNGIVSWVSSETPNLVADGSTYLGDFTLGKNKLGSGSSTIVKTVLAGKCYKVKIKIVQNQAVENEIFGYSFVFKTKKPK